MSVSSPAEVESLLSPPCMVERRSQRASTPSEGESSSLPRTEDGGFQTSAGSSTTEHADHGSSLTARLSSSVLTPQDLDTSALLCDELLSEDSDDSFEPPQKDDEDALLEDFVKEWLGTMQRDDLMPISLLLRIVLVTNLKFGVTEAAEMIGGLLAKSGRTIREWWTQFRANDDVFPDTLQGKYSRPGVLCQNEELDKHAVKYVRQNLAPKGKPNLTATSFCTWVNNSLLPSQVLDPTLPRRISIESARRWLHELGFTIMNRKKGIYFDGDEREDVVAYQKKFLRKMVAIGFLDRDNAPTEEAANSPPDDIEPVTPDRRTKNIVIFHDESTFNANDNQTIQWGTQDMKAGMLRPKSKGSGIMVSDFIDETTGYL